MGRTRTAAPRWGGRLPKSRSGCAGGLAVRAGQRVGRGGVRGGLELFAQLGGLELVLALRVELGGLRLGDTGRFLDRRALPKLLGAVPDLLVLLPAGTAAQDEARREAGEEHQLSAHGGGSFRY